MLLDRKKQFFLHKKKPRNCGNLGRSPIDQPPKNSRMRTRLIDLIAPLRVSTNEDLSRINFHHVFRIILLLPVPLLVTIVVQLKFRGSVKA